MSIRYLFGPVTTEFAGQNLRGPRQAGACRAFDAAGATDLAIGPTDTWEDVCRRLPAGWQPDFVALYLPYTTIPACLWSAPVPLVGLAADWTLLWHGYRRCLRRCERILTDVAGVEALAREGIAQARPANLFGLEHSFLEGPWPDGPRDLDVLFVGNLHPAVQRERLAWLGRLAHLGTRWRVAIHGGVFGADYRRLLGRARIVFNRSLHGECNRRALETAAAGALLFQESGNREVPALFRERRECVYYTADNLEALLTYYLEHEDERRTIAAAARARAASCGFEALWAEQVSAIAQELPELVTRVCQRPACTPREELLGRTWQALGSGVGNDPTLPADLEAALVAEPGAAVLHNALGLAVTLAGQRGGPTTAALAERASHHFHGALYHDPTDVVARLNVAEALVGMEQFAEARTQAATALTHLERLREPQRLLQDAGHFPPAFDHFRVEWERAAWANAGQPAAEAEAKHRLLRWRLQTLLAELREQALGSDLVHAYEAALARPDLPPAQALLGLALLRAHRAEEASYHLRQAVAGNPFDRASALALFQALGSAGDTAGQRRLAEERRLLAQAAPQVVPLEPWFVEGPPSGGELASLIILCCNELAYTRLCLESVLRHTRQPYELLLVDNGSTDDTPAYLEAVRSRPGPERVVVVRNETNRGFPAGCNQGLAQARGHYLVFLNNDTVVAAGWLAGLVAWTLHDWPRVGLVGAVSNCAAAPQQVAIDYQDPSRFDAFAERRRREYAGKAMAVPRLTGFCLLARREVLERCGNFDERYGPGFFDDDDLCLRARRAGFGLLVALDVFVHHFGSRTFSALGIDCPKQLRHNLGLFRDKWGAEEAAHYHPPEAVTAAVPQVGAAAARESAPQPTAVVPALPSGKPQRVSCCLIVRNEEKNLHDCLASVAGIVQEIVIVDTGSTDHTKEIAAAFGARVFDFPWCDSFAAARNESLRHATGDWIFWIDADDRLDEENRANLRRLFTSLNGENVAYSMKCLCLPDPRTKTGTVVDHVRLFRNHPAIRWEHRVHEQILPAVRRSGGEVRWSDVVIHHVGYQDAAVQHHKQERNLRLLQLEHAEQPDHPFTLFNLGSTYQEMGRPGEALVALRRSLERSVPADSIVRKLYALIAQCHRQLGQASEALAVCRAGRGHYPDDAELLFHEAELRHQLGDRAAAIGCLERLLEGREAAHFASLDAGICSYKARHNLAVLFQEEGHLAEAEAQWRAAVAAQPLFAPSWVALAELCLEQRRFAELEQVCEQMALAARADMEAAVLRARGYLARREFGTARGLLAETIVRFPQAVWPRLILSHALLQEGQDWAAAEQALRDVLALDPDNVEARRNLGMLLRQLGRPSESI